VCVCVCVCVCVLDWLVAHNKEHTGAHSLAVSTEEFCMIYEHIYYGGGDIIIIIISSSSSSIFLVINQLYAQILVL